MASLSGGRVVSHNNNGGGLLPSTNSPRVKKTPTSKFINSLQSPDHTPSTTATTPSPSSSPLLQGEFYAIRKGKGVKHCIFASWDDAKEHVANYKDAVYNVFSSMQDALLYIRLPTKTTSHSNNNKAGVASQKRKRTAMLPCSSTAAVNTKKPRTVSITQDTPLPPPSTIATYNNNKENQVVARPIAKVPPVEAEASSLSAAKPSSTTSTTTSDETTITTAMEDGRPLPKILEEGYKNSYIKGWRANQLFPAKKQCREQWEKRYLEDVTELKTFRQNQSKSSSVRDVHKMNHCSGIPNAFSLAYLNWSWGVGEAYHRYLAFQQRKQRPTGSRQRMKNNKLKATTTPANRSNHYSCSTCVITNREAAKKRFTAKAMFYSFRVQQLAEMSTTNLSKEDLPARPRPDEMHNQSPLVNGCSRSKEWMDEARADWETQLSPEDKAYWEEQARLHDEKQPEILKILEDSLRRDPKRSAKKLSEDINFWCGKTTIGKWKNLRIGPSYRKGISEPVSRDDQHAHMNATAIGTAAATTATSTNASTSFTRRVLAPVSTSNGTKTGNRLISLPQTAGLNVAAVLPAEVSEPSESTEDPYSGDEYYDEGPSPTECPSSSKKKEMEAHMEETDLVI